MICLIALVVFGVLGIFSASHRKIAFEAFDCVFKRLTLKPCDSGLDKRLKSQITGKLMKRTPKLAKFTFKNFEALSWVFTILMFWSMINSGIGIYNYVVFGNCNGENSQEFCAYSGLIDLEVSCKSPLCSNEACTCLNEVDCQEEPGEPCQQSCYEGT